MFLKSFKTKLPSLREPKRPLVALFNFNAIETSYYGKYETEPLTPRPERRGFTLHADKRIPVSLHDSSALNDT